MARGFVGIGFGLTIALFFVLYEIGWGSSEPMFFRQGTTRAYSCYLELGPGDHVITVEFQEDGRSVIVESLGERRVLEFQSGGMAGDRYGTGDVTLIIDPEAYLYGMGEERRGPCY